MTNAILHKTIIFENACLAEFYVTNRAPSMNESSPSWNESSPSTTYSLTFRFFLRMTNQLESGIHICNELQLQF